MTDGRQDSTYTRDFNFDIVVEIVVAAVAAVDSNHLSLVLLVVECSTCLPRGTVGSESWTI